MRARDAAVVTPPADAGPPVPVMTCAGAAIDLEAVVAAGACRRLIDPAGVLEVAIAPAVVTARPGARAVGRVEWRNRTAEVQPLALRVADDRLVSIRDRVEDPTGKVDTRVYPRGGCGSGFIGRPEWAVVEIAPGGRASLRVEVEAVARTLGARCETTRTTPLPPGRYELEVRVDDHTARGALEVSR